jgi:hypothetical protein
VSNKDVVKSIPTEKQQKTFDETAFDKVPTKEKKK